MSRALSAAAVRLLLCAAALLGASGCASDPPGARESLALRGPSTSGAFYADQGGREAVLDVRLELFGASLEALRVETVGADGRAAAAPEAAAVGERVAAVVGAAEGGASVLRFAPALPDGAVFELRATVAEGAPSPFRLRLTPIVRR